MTIEYFMDCCWMWEVEDCLDCIPYTDRNLKELQRVCAYVNAQTQTTKKISPQDIMKFKWDDEKYEEESDTEISNEDINRLKQLAKQWEN